MVRTSFINEITNTISASDFFEAADFNISVKATNESYRLQIDYKYNPNFWFVSSIPIEASGQSKISFTMTPGEINAKESDTAYGKSGLTGAINEWLGRVKEELLAIPIYRQVQEQSQSLEEMLKRLQTVEDVAFTSDEAQRLKADLDRLREQLIEQIKANAESQAEQDKKIKTISSDVDALKASVEVLNKPNWARAALTRFYKWTKDSDNRGLLKDGVEVAAKLLSGQVNGK